MVRTRSMKEVDQGSTDDSPTNSDDEVDLDEFELRSRDASSDDDFDLDEFELRSRDAGFPKNRPRTRLLGKKLSTSKALGQQKRATTNQQAENSSKTRGVSITADKSPVKKDCSKQGTVPAATTTTSTTPPFQTRFSMHRIGGLVKKGKISKKQKQWIYDTGFGSLLSMAHVSVPVHLVAWIMKYINTSLREFRYKNKVIVFDRQLVCNILGVPSGPNVVNQNCTAAEYHAFEKIRRPFMYGARASFPKVHQVLTTAKNKKTFLRAFILIALGSVLCSTTDNAVPTRFLHSLTDADISHIREFDWAEVVLQDLMAEVDRYQIHCLRIRGEPPPKTVPHFGSCLIILAIAYMDSLDIHPDRVTYKIDYSVPRVCHVTKEDFEFISRADNVPGSSVFGFMPFRRTSPYPHPVPLSGYIPEEEPTVEEEHVQVEQEPAVEEEEAVVGSLDGWMGVAGPSSHDASHTRAAAGQSLPKECQMLLEEYNANVERDVDELTQKIVASLKEGTKMIFQKRGAELAAKISHAKTALDVINLASQLSDANFSFEHAQPSPKPNHSKDPTASTSTMPEDQGANTACTSGMAAHVPTFTAEYPSQPMVQPLDASNVLNPTPGEDDTSKGGEPFNPTQSTKTPQDTSNRPGPSLPAEETFKQAMPSPAKTPEHVSACDPPPFNLFPEDDPLFHDVCGDGSRISSHTVDKSIEHQTGPSTLDKKNRHKRKALHLNPAEKAKKLKVDDTTIEIWRSYLARRAFSKGFKLKDQIESPPFIEISKFHVSYDEFYESLKPKDLVGNALMSLWCLSFNLDQIEMKNTIVKKFVFPQIATEFLKVALSLFTNTDSCIRLYKRVNEKYALAKMDLLFFPIVCDHHWVLVCASMFMKQFAFFDSLGAGSNISSLKDSKNVIQNFVSTVNAAGIMKTDFSDFEWTYPTGYPTQKNLHDCGIYTMQYIEAWNGKEMMSLSLATDYRKCAAARLVLSKLNVIDPKEFEKKYMSSKP